MKGQNLIKLFDEAIPKELHHDLPKVEPLFPWESEHLSEMDPRVVGLKKDLRGIFQGYQFLASLCPRSDQVDLENLDFSLQAIEGEGSLGFSTMTMGQRRDVVTLVLFMDHNVTIRFPGQGLSVCGRPRRAVAFPSNWTHPWKLMGKGVVVFSRLRYHDVPSIIGTN